MKVGFYGSLVLLRMKVLFWRSADCRSQPCREARLFFLYQKLPRMPTHVGMRMYHKIFIQKRNKLMKTNVIQPATDARRMTSLEIAELTGKQHNDLMKAIRKMVPAWEKVQGGKFSLLQKIYQLPNGGTKLQPYYSLTKTECLYIATKFNDEARAKLVLRWEELERRGLTPSPSRRGEGSVTSGTGIADTSDGRGMMEEG